MADTRGKAIDIELPVQPEAMAFDLDGTLLDYEGRMAGNVLEAVKRIMSTGIKVFLLTGRLLASCEHFWRELGLATPLATCNGAHIGVPGQEPLFHKRHEPDIFSAVIDLAEQHDLYVNYYIDNRVYALKDGPDFDYYSLAYCPVNLAKGREELMRLGRPTKMLCIAAENETPATRRLFAEHLGERVDITESSRRFVEIMVPDVNKGTALQFLADWSGIPKNKWMAVGDGLNDLPMLQIAGFGITFESGDDRLFGHVDAVLEPLWRGGMRQLADSILGMTRSGRFTARKPL